MNKYIVNSEEEIYQFLRNKLVNMSKNNIKSLLKNEKISVNDKIITKYDYPLKKGDVINISSNKYKDVNLDIIYEDNNIIVINKPTKILTIANKNEKENTLYRKVSDYLKKKNEKVFIIHRLDFDTSGVIMFAKSERIKNLYQEKWNSLAKERKYIAVVEGIINQKGHIESYLKQNKNLFVYSSKNKDGYFSITDYERIKNNKDYSLVSIYISTGRRNQIRCHMSDINHPIIGDKRYNSKTNPISRLALHAYKLKIINPLTNELMTFECKIPNEFTSIFKESN